MKILVTGGASGLGRSITKTLAQSGDAEIWFTWCSSSDKANELESTFANVNGLQCDFTNTKSLQNLLAQVDKLDLDGMVNNATTGFARKHFHKLPPSEFERGFRENMLPIIELAQHVLLGFKKRKHGRMVTILSSAMLGTPPPGWSEYVASKSYLAALAKSWATEYGKFGVTSNCISPSFMKTALTADFDERMVEMMEQSNPLKRLLSTKEVAETVLFLLTASPFINGLNIPMSAGQNTLGL